MSMVMTKNLKENIFVDRGFNISRQVFTPATRRKDLQQARVIRERREAAEENKSMSIKDLLNARLKEAQPQRDTATTDSINRTKPDSTTVNKSVVDSTAVSNTDSTVGTDSSAAQVAPKDSAVTKAKTKMLSTPTIMFLKMKQ